MVIDRESTARTSMGSATALAAADAAWYVADTPAGDVEAEHAVVAVGGGGEERLLEGAG